MFFSQKPIPTKLKIETREVAERFSVLGDLEISVKTFGTSLQFDFVTKNMSKSGLLIRSQANPLPYRENTLLEINVDPKLQRITKPVSLMGKVTRRVDLTSGEVDLGISVIGELSDMEGWNQCVSSFEKVALQRASSSIKADSNAG